jgi:hypothetical protein
MSKTNYDYIKAESQRMNVSMTAYLNFLLDSFINRQNLNLDGTTNDSPERAD